MWPYLLLGKPSIHLLSRRFVCSECSCARRQAVLCWPSWTRWHWMELFTVAVACWCRPPTRELEDFCSGGLETTGKEGVKKLFQLLFQSRGLTRSVPSEFSGLELRSHSTCGSPNCWRSYDTVLSNSASLREKQRFRGILLAAPPWTWKRIRMLNLDSWTIRQV